MNPSRALVRIAPIIAAVLLSVVNVSAQTRPQPRPPSRPAVPPPPPPTFAVRLFADGGVNKFAAGRSFNAILGKDSGPVYGGGGEVVFRGRWFARVDLWRFKGEGERAIRLENQTFPLGIPLTVTIMPIEVDAGVRMPLGRRRALVPYAGAGVSSHSYKETSSFATGEENVNERFTGYQILGGVEYRLHRVIGIAGEVQYTTVPDAIGAGGLSAEFNENDLGGLIVRARVLFGR
ncbi:MAG: outer membrane beta-barrel protein [Vicinamibacterales bacterium]